MKGKEGYMSIARAGHMLSQPPNPEDSPRAGVVMRSSHPSEADGARAMYAGRARIRYRLDPGADMRS